MAAVLLGLLAGSLMEIGFISQIYGWKESIVAAASVPTFYGAWKETVRKQGIRNFYTWTAGYEAPSFYRKLGYTMFGELKDYYPTGHSRLVLRKSIK